MSRTGDMLPQRKRFLIFQCVRTRGEIRIMRKNAIGTGFSFHHDKIL